MKKILVIDDEEWLREMIHLALKQKGFTVVEAANGAEGIEIARKELPDLILCDVNMEKVDGYLTLTSLRNEAPTAAIPFILMTGLADNVGMRHGMELGADDYLPKPFTTDALYAAVDARLKKAQTVRDEAERTLASLRDNISLIMPHEMRTPLNGIISNAELLATSAATLKPGEIAEMGQEIHKSSQRLERLIENFLIYAQLELIAADPKNVSALRIGKTEHTTALIQELATAQAAQAGRPADLSVEAADLLRADVRGIFRQGRQRTGAKCLQVFRIRLAGARHAGRRVQQHRSFRQRSGLRFFHRANQAHRRLCAVRPENAGPAGIGTGVGHRQTAG